MIDDDSSCLVDGKFKFLWNFFTLKADCKLCQIHLSIDTGDLSHLLLHLHSFHNIINNEQHNSTDEQQTILNKVDIKEETEEYLIPPDKEKEEEDQFTDNDTCDDDWDEMKLASNLRTGGKKIYKEEREEEDEDDEKDDFDAGDLDEDYEPLNGDDSNHLDKGDDYAEISTDISSGKKSRRRKFTIWDHWISLEDGSHECKLCGLIKNAGIQSLTKHMKDEHSKVWKETNEKREQYYKSRREFEINRPKNPYKCIGIFSEVWEHFIGKPLSDPTLTCKICQTEVAFKKSQRTRTAYKHMAEEHQMFENKFISEHLCPYCGKSFKNKNPLQTHIATHTGNFKYFCPYEGCNKGFMRKDSIYHEHYRSHTGEKPFLCTNCGQSFNSKQMLKNHMRKHTGDTKYQCQFCQKIFTTRLQQVAHERIHTGERPFKCDEFGQRFVQKPHLNTHKKLKGHS